MQTFTLEIVGLNRNFTTFAAEFLTTNPSEPLSAYGFKLCLDASESAEGCQETLNMKRVAFFLLGCLSAMTCAIAQINTDRVLSIGRNALYFEDYVLSIQYFNEVIAVKPYLPEPYLYRSIAKIYLDDYLGASQDATACLERNPFITTAHQVRGIAGAVHELPHLVLHAGHGKREGDSSSCLRPRDSLLHPADVPSGPPLRRDRPCRRASGRRDPGRPVCNLPASPLAAQALP